MFQYDSVATHSTGRPFFVSCILVVYNCRACLLNASEQEVSSENNVVLLNSASYAQQILL